MGDIEIYTRVPITIFGLAYPILLQVIARLDEKYASTHIVELFDTENAKIWFQRLLIISLISIFIWSFKLPPLIKVNGLDALIENSANLLVFLSATSLVIAFFFFVNKIIIYYTPAKFINYLIKNHKKKDSDLRFFNALSDVFIFAVQKQNQNISLTISRFFYDAFKTERQKAQNNEVVYPEAYYSLVYKTIEELAIIKNKKNAALEYRTAGSIWLLGELQGNIISEWTYQWLWSNMLLAVKYEQDDMVLFHWETAHQYFWTGLKRIQPKRDNTRALTNSEEVESRDLERKRFLEFHFFLGALLLYEKRYACIQRIFNYTTSEPPKYELLPNSMNDIFFLYNDYRQPFDFDHYRTLEKYRFPKQNGLTGESIIKKNLYSYFALLFIRQYFIHPFYISSLPLAFPNIPTAQNSKKNWIDNLPYFKNLVSEILENKVLLENLDYNIITKEWCEQQGKIYPLDFLDELLKKLEQEYLSGSFTVPISAEKVKQFLNSSKEILETTIDSLFEISNTNEIETDFNNWFKSGRRIVQNKDAFSESPEAHHMNFDSFLGNVCAEELRDQVANTFRINTSKKYLLKPEDIFPAIDKIGLNDNYIIVGFGMNLHTYLDFLKVKGLTNTHFHNLKLFNFNTSGFISQTLFLINKNDLPKIIMEDISQEIKTKYELDPISEKYNLFGSVIDLNLKSKEFREENSTSNDDQELRKSVLSNINFSIEIRWKKNIDLIQIMEYSEYRQKGLPNTLEEVKSIGVK